MSQQINLLPPAPHRPALSAQRALITLSVWALMVLCLSWSGSRGVEAARLADQRSAQELTARQQMLQALQDKLGEADSPHDIGAQIAALEPQTRVSRDLLERLKTGELGSLNGYAGQLTEFASIPQRGVWVTMVTVSNAGRTLRVDGRALKKEQILPYAALLNGAMGKYGIALTHIEVAPLRQTVEDDESVTPVWTFKLY